MKTPTNKGTASSQASGTSLTLASVAIAQGASIIVGVVHDPVTISSVKWNSIDLAQDVGPETNTGNVQGSLWSLHNVTGATGSVVVTFASAITAKAMFVTQLLGEQTIAFERGASSQGTGTTPSSGATGTTTRDDEYCIGVVGTEGPAGDTLGSWGGGFTAGQNAGTTISSPADANVKVTEGRLQIIAAAAVTASKSGIPSRDWVALVGCYYETGTPILYTTQTQEHKLWQLKQLETTQTLEHKLYGKREIETTQTFLHKVYFAPTMAQVRTTHGPRHIVWTKGQVDSTQAMIHRIWHLPPSQLRTTHVLEHKVWKRALLETTHVLRHLIYVAGAAPPEVEEAYCAVI